MERRDWPSLLPDLLSHVGARVLAADVVDHGVLECRLTRHDALRSFRHWCSGRFERHRLGTHDGLGGTPNISFRGSAGARPRPARATRPSATPASARAAGSRSATATACARQTRARSPYSTPPPAGASASACRSSRATASSALRMASSS
jgi:hypothetical protein